MEFQKTFSCTYPKFFYLYMRIAGCIGSGTLFALLPMPPGDFFLPHVRMIRKIMYQLLIAPGYFDSGESDDLLQQIEETLLIREEKILACFQGKARFTTFLSVVITNICLEIRRKEIRNKKRTGFRFMISSSVLSVPLFNKMTDQSLLPDDKLVILETVRKLHLILLTYMEEMPKITFCLKAHYQIPLSGEEINLDGLPPDKRLPLKVHLQALDPLSNKLSRKTINLHLTAIFSILEHRHNTPDAIRKWIEIRVAAIIHTLNGHPPVSSFDQVTFQYLFDLYCKNQSELSPKCPFRFIQSNKPNN